MKINDLIKALIVVIGVTIAVLLSKALAKHFRKSGLSDRAALLKGLKIVCFSLLGIAMLGAVVGAAIPSLKMLKHAKQYSAHTQTVDINDFLPAELKTSPAIWKAVDEKSGNSVYLMGTIHILTDKTLPFPDYVTEAYETCEVLAVEQIPDDNSESNLEGYKLSDGRKIYNELSEDTYGAAKDFLKDRGLYFDYFDDYNAEFWYSLVYEAVVSGIKDIDYTHGVDSYFIELAKKDGKKLVGIDSSIKNGLPTPSIELTEYMIRDLIENSERAAAYLAEVYTNWANGDIDKLIEDDKSAIPEELLDDYERYQKSLIADRNIVMINSIEKLIKDGGNVFVTVGAAHFAGDYGIISLLTRRGYTVERIG